MHPAASIPGAAASGVPFRALSQCMSFERPKKGHQFTVCFNLPRRPGALLGRSLAPAGVLSQPGQAPVILVDMARTIEAKAIARFADTSGD
ncbi:hypothetical protein C666_13350 [Thauera linaloolentis 47Lol = DSM 12138]|uniref:Uncharacterized protein n=1 Tax=Thauera linaloolentis (strain DSM 12138 / JCM 21573 / CCUG 41526 / CIP 105981 / IAM 15112 / NBRC 102519 / 47Lol) TaxID=1123367 RepID=N6YW39_THAL4|nr:hypothetical protein C666_13350 [Thauera linaloolentis 47Lol = DSM 12138]